MKFGQTVTGKYDRKIRYLDYMENGVRSLGAGFAKMERWDETCSIYLQISGLYRKDHFTRPLLILDRQEERELCRLQFAEGGVKCLLENLDVRDLGGQGVSYDGLIGFRIPISEGKEIVCIWGEAGATRQILEESEADMEMPKEPESRQSVQTMEMPKEPESRQSVQTIEMPKELESRQSVQTIEMPKEPESRQSVQMVEIPKEPEGKQSAEMEKSENHIEKEVWMQTEEEDEEPEDRDGMPPALMREDKWEQLLEVYPHIFPFCDGREYLSIGPADFVILPGRYYRLVSNSFLLHGFYNYDHLILARMEQRGAAKYYIGVPGNYYEKEKRVAVLFGFESFECESEPAQEGDFGYYMIPVGL